MRVLALLVLGSFGLSAAGSAQAYELYTSESGANLRWRVAALTLDVSPLLLPASVSAEAALAAVSASVAPWMAIDCHPPVVTAVLDEAARLNDADMEASIVWFDDVAVWNAGFSQLELARTIVIHRVQSGTIVDADIAVNLGGYAFAFGEACDPELYDLRSTLTHELGHFFGIDHSQVPSATMARRSDPGDCEMRTLDPDDVAGFCALYDRPDPPEAAEPEPTPEPTAEPVAEPEVVEEAVAEIAERRPRDDGCCSGGPWSLWMLLALALRRRMG